MDTGQLLWSDAFFARTKTKQLGKSGETFIWNAKEGEVKHPVSGKHLPPWVPDTGAFELPPEKDRREVFAEWLTKPGNPFFAKVEVNRIWASLMGLGIVEPFDDFRDTNPPSNELSGHLPKISLKADSIVASHSKNRQQRYQTSGESNEFNRDDTRFFSFRQPRRLEAEQLVDALGQVTGKPMNFLGVPVTVKAVHLPAPDLAQKNRSMIGDIEFLKVFGQPERQTVCSCERAGDAGLGQALQLFNGKLFNRCDGWRSLLKGSFRQETFVRNRGKPASLCTIPIPQRKGEGHCLGLFGKGNGQGQGIGGPLLGYSKPQ